MAVSWCPLLRLLSTALPATYVKLSPSGMKVCRAVTASLFVSDRLTVTVSPGCPLPPVRLSVFCPCAASPAAIMIRKTNFFIFVLLLNGE